jgi:hypothetical protein
MVGEDLGALGRGGVAEKEPEEDDKELAGGGHGFVVT